MKCKLGRNNYTSGGQFDFLDGIACFRPADQALLVIYESIATVGKIPVWWRADFQSGSRVLKKVF